MASTESDAPRYSINYYTGDGSKTIWEFNFAGGYISRDHVKAVAVNPDDSSYVLPLNFIGDNTVEITPAVPDGVEFRIYRDTPKDKPIANFSDGSYLTESNLDVNADQAVFIAAEAFDRFGDDTGAIGIVAEAEEIKAAAAASAGAAALSALDSSAAASRAVTSSNHASLSEQDAATSATAAQNLVAAAQALAANYLFPAGTVISPLPASVTNVVADGGAFLIQGASGGNAFASLYRRSGTSGVYQNLDIPSAAVLTALSAIMASVTPAYVDGKQLSLAITDAAGAPYFGTMLDGSVFVQSLRVNGAKFDVTNPSYLDGKQCLFEIVDGNDKTVSAVFVDGSTYSAAADSVGTKYLDGKQLILEMVDDSGALIAGWFLDGTSTVVGSGSTAPVVAKPNGAAFGDSLTQSTNGEPPWPDLLAALLGCTVLNAGIGGQTGPQIHGRIGSLVHLFTIDSSNLSGGAANKLVTGANQVVAIDGVAVSTLDANSDLLFLGTRGGTASYSAVGTLGSVRGTLTRTASAAFPAVGADTYTFTPDADQTLPAFVPSGTPFVVENTHMDDFWVVWPNRNDYTRSLADIAAQDQATFNMKADGKIIFMPVINGYYSTEYYSTSGSSYYQANFLAIEKQRAKMFPANFLNVRRKLIDSGLAASGITPTLQDQIDIGNDIVPWSLRTIPFTGSLTAACTASDTTISLALTRQPVASGQLIKVDSEFMLVTGVSGSSYTVTRGVSGSAAASHASGAAFVGRDTLHLNSTANALIAGWLRDFITKKGWR